MTSDAMSVEVSRLAGDLFAAEREQLQGTLSRIIKANTAPPVAARRANAVPR
jgi:hypothetical protein